jgi:hypothetical protein
LPITNAVAMSNDESRGRSKRGLASATEETRQRVAKSGGDAAHRLRGLQAANAETRRAVAVKGGKARGAQRKSAVVPQASVH